jgi:hypothetical protein
VVTCPAAGLAGSISAVIVFVGVLCGGGDRRADAAAQVGDLGDAVVWRGDSPEITEGVGKAPGAEGAGCGEGLACHRHCPSGIIGGHGQGGESDLAQRPRPWVGLAVASDRSGQPGFRRVRDATGLGQVGHGMPGLAGVLSGGVPPDVAGVVGWIGVRELLVCLADGGNGVSDPVEFRQRAGRQACILAR